MSDQVKMVKVRILKVVGPYMPGQEVEVDEQTAQHLCDGHKAMKVEDYDKKLSDDAKAENMTVAEMHEKKMRNRVGEPSQKVKDDAKVYELVEKAAQAGRPVAAPASELVTTGGITPPDSVFPVMAKLGGHPVTKLEDVKPKKEQEKKPEQKPEQKPVQPQAPVKPEEKKPEGK